MDKRVTPAVLVDTSALLALANPRDSLHADASRVAKSYRDSGGRFFGTVLVLGEFHAHLLYLAGPGLARSVVTDLMDDPLFLWLDVGFDLVSAATSAWLERYADQRFSLIDAVSFEVMRQERIEVAFAFDRHFQIAGYQLLQ